MDTTHASCVVGEDGGVPQPDATTMGPRAATMPVGARNVAARAASMSRRCKTRQSWRGTRTANDDGVVASRPTMTGVCPWLGAGRFMAALAIACFERKTTQGEEDETKGLARRSDHSRSLHWTAGARPAQLLGRHASA